MLMGKAIGSAKETTMDWHLAIRWRMAISWN
jgi:hypothetical protein